MLGKLDYIKSLGVDAIWFSPLYVSPQKDYGYDIADYRNINPEYGTMDDFKAVLDGAHERGMKVIMDLVVNHTSDQHEWFKKSAAKDPKYKDYYIWRPGRGKDGKKFPNNWMSTFPGNAWEWNEERGEYYLHLFAVEQPDLNHDNPAVREEVKSVMRFWLDMGVDGFREDVITYISKRGAARRIPSAGNARHGALFSGAQHPQVSAGIQTGGQRLRRFPTRRSAHDDSEKRAQIHQEGKDQQLDMMFQFQHMEADCFMTSYLRTKFNLRKLKKVYRNWQHKMYGVAWNTNYLENHDQPRVISRYGSEKYRTESGKALATLYTFMSGTHFVYQGQEIGMLDYPFKDWSDFVDVATFCAKGIMEKTHLFSKKKIFENCAYAARDNARTCMQWSAEANGGFTTGTPWFHVNPNYKDINVAAEESDSGSLLNYYRKVIALRKEYKDAAVYGRYVEKMASSKKIFAYDKIAEDGGVLTVVINMTDGEVSASRAAKCVPEGAEHILGNYGGSMAAVLKPYEAHVYYKAPAK